MSGTYTQGFEYRGIVARVFADRFVGGSIGVENVVPGGIAGLDNSEENSQQQRNSHRSKYPGSSLVPAWCHFVPRKSTAHNIHTYQKPYKQVSPVLSHPFKEEEKGLSRPRGLSGSCEVESI